MTQNNKKLIAVTGGIGSGKSLVLRYLENEYPVFSCDEENKKLLSTHLIKEKIKSLFPRCVSGEKRLKLNKKELANIVFSKKAELKKLNDLLHPYIIKSVLKKANKEKSPLCFIEVPLLFESNLEKNFDDVIIILRDKDERIKSVVERSNLSVAEINKRIENQVDYDKIDKSKYLLLYNDKGKEELYKKIEDLLKKL